MEIQDAKQARPHCELIAELLDSRQPKTEREHAAEREIERLRHDIERHIAIASEYATECERLRAELAEAKKLKDGMLDVLGGACPNDHRSTPFEEFKGCTPCLRAELAEARRDAERYRWLRSDDCPFSCYEQEGPDNWGWCPTSSRDLDEAIDAAMAGDSAPESAATATRL